MPPKLSLPVVVKAAVVLTALPCAARADVFIEISPYGLPANGVVDTVGIGQDVTYNVYVWGSGAGHSLIRSLAFSIGSPTNGYFFTSRGTLDPLNQFSTDIAGTFSSTGLSGVSLLSLTTPVQVGSTPGTALLICTGVHASAIQSAAVMTLLQAQAGVESGPPPTVQVIGVIETPAPGTGVMLGLGAILIGVRRRA